jgi:hypothetical protein
MRERKDMDSARVSRRRVASAAFALAPALLAWAAVALASDERITDCKNHYILEPPCPVSADSDVSVRISKLFSTLDATTQAIELEVVGALDRPVPLAGRTMTVRDRKGNVRSFTLADPLYRYRDKLLIVGSAWGVNLDGMWGPNGDLAMPGYFLPIDGGDIAIEGMDAAAFGALPVDGSRALARDGTVVRASFAFWGTYDIDVTAIAEFYHPVLDHYFMTSRADEVALLLSGAIPGWQPTGKAISAASRPLGDGYRPVCRYLLERPPGYSHFFSASGDECAALAGAPGNVLESSAAFYVGVPVDGVCATTGSLPGGGGGVIGAPVYRLWNGKPDTNHRFVTDKADRDAMVARGWISEGAGLDGVAMCAWSVDLPLPPGQ